MAFPKLWNPGMGGLVQDQATRLRLPMPGYKDPYTGVGRGLAQYPTQQGIGGMPPSGPQIPSPLPRTTPQQPYPGTIPENPSTIEGEAEAFKAATKPKLEVSPFMTNMYKSIQNIDPEQRGEYLSTTAASIKDKMDRFEFRIARGVPLSPEMQRQYENLRGAYNDIQKYINNPAPYDELFGGWASNIAQAQQNANPNRGAENQIAMGRRFAGG